MISNAEWIERMRGVDVARVARALRLEVRAFGGQASPGTFPCPSCGAARRHTKTRDRRGACGIRPDGKGWCCHQCGETGDAITLVRAVEGERAREWCERFLNLDVLPSAASTDRAEPLRMSDPAIRELWRWTVPVTSDEEVSSYLGARHINAAVVADLDIARALPHTAQCPSWAHHRPDGEPYGSWVQTNHRLVVLLCDGAGRTRGVLGRRVDHRASDPRKTTFPRGYSRAGIVIADRLARETLAARAWPAIDGPICASAAEGPRLIICEGEIDYLTIASLAGDAREQFVAHVGIDSGSWTKDLADRVPDGTRVTIATDHDEQGERYAATIVGMFEGRNVELRRWRP